MVHALDLFADLPGVTEVLGPEQFAMDATYYDTADLRLAKAGIRLCRRSGGTDEGWFVTLPDGRRGMRVPLARSSGEVPSELITLVRAHTGERPLRRSAHIGTARNVWRLASSDSAAFAEVAVDDVSAQALGDIEGPVRTWCEAGALSGPSNLLDADWFASADVTPLDEAGRFVRITGGPVPCAPRLAESSSGGAVVVAYLREQVRVLRVADVLLRLDDPDGVHDMRVFVRRLRSCLKVFRKIIDVPSSLSAELKWLSDSLGDARDAEVLSEGLFSAVNAVPAELVLGPVRAETSRHLAKSAARASAALRGALAGQRYLDLLSAVDVLLAEPPYLDLAHRRAVRALPPLVAKAWRKARSSAAMALSLERGSAKDNAMHDTRKAVKRLRYAAETVEPVLGSAAARYQRRCKKAQGVLGDHHDLVVLRPVLRELGVLAHLDGANGFTFGLMYADACTAMVSEESRFASAWDRLAARKTRRWMA
jgi:CHAD domain-containing protein